MTALCTWLFMTEKDKGHFEIVISASKINTRVSYRFFLAGGEGILVLGRGHAYCDALVDFDYKLDIVKEK